jgi:Tfp pilus assembly protein PilN
MTRFDFLGNRGARARMIHALVEMLREEPGMRGATLALAGAIAIVALAYDVESLRFARAHAAFATAATRLAASERSLQRARSGIDTVDRLSAAAQEVRAIRRSGRRHAAELAEIGDRLPGSLWLTALHEDNGAVTIHGGARDLSEIGRAMDALGHARTVHTPRLVSLHTADGFGIEYELRLAEREP